jgi:Zn-dependent protease
VEGGACAACGIELSPRLLACPRCGRLVHLQRLKELSERAEASAREERPSEAIATWRQALALLPPGAPQAEAVGERIEELLRRPAARDVPAESGRAEPRSGAWKGLAGLGVLGVLVAGLTKLPMIAGALGMFGVLWTIYGWKLAAGVLVSLYLHEVGHALMMAARGMTVSAPMFVPGLGAYVRMSERPATPAEENRVGLAGPAAGLAVALASCAIGWIAGSPLFLAIASVGALINILNLCPVWQLDGKRGFESLVRWQRVAVAAAFAIALAITGERVLLLPLAICAFVAVTGRPARRADATGFAVFLGLIAALSAVTHLAGRAAS